MSREASCDDPYGTLGDSGTATPLPRLWSATELLNTKFPEPRWAVPGLISEGLTLFCGPPKVGKSWACLCMGAQVAAGNKVFNAIETAPGQVLYLALEDPPRRMQQRLRAVLGDDSAPSGLTIANDWSSVPEGGAKDLSEWLDAHPDCRMVMIDVFARIKGRGATQSTDAYLADYDGVKRLKAVADQRRVSIVVVHHVRKAGASDILDMVSGTNGLAGAADTILIMARSRGTSDANLFVTGRDVDENNYALRFDKDSGRWEMLNGPAETFELSSARQRLLRHLEQQPVPLTPKAIASALGANHQATKQTLHRMAQDGQITRNNQGEYLPLSLSPLSPELPLSPLSPESPGTPNQSERSDASAPAPQLLGSGGDSGDRGTDRLSPLSSTVSAGQAGSSNSGDRGTGTCDLCSGTPAVWFVREQTRRCARHNPMLKGLLA
jgi:hypothetical protein